MTEPPGPARRPTIMDVARLAGVSRSAVSKVFNARPGISPATQARIREAAEQLQWEPSATAKALRSARAETVGLILSRSASGAGVPSPLVAGMEGVIAAHGIGLLVQITASEQDERRVYRHLREARRVDGVVLTDSRVGDRRFDLVRELRLPSVLVGTPWREDPIAHIPHGRDGAGMREVADHLLSLGHRQIGVVAGPPEQVGTRDRSAALRARLEEGGGAVVLDLPGSYSGDSAAQRTEQLLAAAPGVTAIVYATDQMAIAGMYAARRAGRQVPRDLSIVGYNGSSLGVWVDPPLTSVSRDLVQRGRAAAALLLELIGVAGVRASDHPVPAPALVVRESTGPAA